MVFSKLALPAQKESRKRKDAGSGRNLTTQPDETGGGLSSRDAREEFRQQERGKRKRREGRASSIEYNAQSFKSVKAQRREDGDAPYILYLILCVHT